MITLKWWRIALVSVSALTAGAEIQQLTKIHRAQVSWWDVGILLVIVAFTPFVYNGEK